MVSKLFVRKFNASDIDRIVEIEKSAFIKGPYSRRRLLSLAKNHADDFLVAVLAGEIAGYIIAYHKAGVIDFDSLAVAKEYQGQGIGQKLIKFVLGRFDKKKTKKASLEVRKNNEKAIALFKKLGFEIVKVIKGYYKDGEDAYLMVLTDFK